ncbi:MAG: hypothetical protein VX476_00570 [Actinomycetota bacterium]|nr:hypothetical protein [Actinomycetota bacterium]MED5276391.1 hypothetical protein [Actinomycetota bacterium]|tara:strand:- start:16728 stop:16937 length:210 start_codon:yes stop_codon:yes gene_type:complete
MERLSIFENNRFIGDKRTQEVYDLDEADESESMRVLIDELVENETYICFAPDTLAEARNRGYRLRKINR